ncbi:hypothetical protein EG68_04904 [Paragonimus skrjabini miyazakii]|uniref:Uncharacterized protein n=1 Tax=Paragonimus skrjabini miyazakii TaxID=59628 RepID=A0A8S9YT16_9TREM|nr:hypothetical protein EG68_04904 [Paragonimus skrjabini miyazakii]
MGNRHTHGSSITIKKDHPRPSSRPFSVTSRDAEVQKYLQPPSETLNNYLRSHASQYQETQTDFDKPLEPLGYREAYEHLRDLADKQIKQLHASTSAAGEFGSLVAVNGDPQPLDKKLRNGTPRWIPGIFTKNTKQTHISDKVTSVTGGLGDKQSPNSQSPYDSGSEDVAVRLDVDSATIKSTNSHRATPYDQVAKTGDHRTISYSSGTTEEGDGVPLYQHQSNVLFNSENLQRLEGTSSKSISIARNLRTIQEPTHKRSRFEEFGERSLTPNSAANNRERGDLRRTFSMYNQYYQRKKLLPSQTKNWTSQMGFQTQPDGTLTYTAFIRSGPCGVPVEGWLGELHKRAARYLTGLRRQYRCFVHLDPDLIAYRGLFVHALVISGQNQSDLIRCRNALPACIEKHLITPYANHGTTVRSIR